MNMGKTVRIPDPVYSRLTTEADRRDISRGAVVEDWMDKAEKYDQLERDRR